MKIFTYILNKRLTAWLECNEVLSDLQNGFRPNRSCQEHMITLHNIALNRKLNGEDTYCCFIDFRKAFDSVDRKLLWQKLIHYGVNGPFLGTLKCMYAGFECAVEVNGSCTPWFNVSNGVKQGCLLSPSLFNLFVNDLLLSLSASEHGIDCGGDTKIPALAFADDIVLIAPNPQKLQALINMTFSWCTKNGIQFNLQKTKVMHIRHKRRPQSSFVFKCGNNQIQYCDEYKYLGLWINQYLDTKEIVGKVNLAARRALGCLISKAKALGGLSYNTYTYLYDTLVAPVMDYSSCIWGSEHYNTLEVTQNNALRFFLGVGRSHPIVSLQGDMGWIPAGFRHNLQFIKWWLRTRSQEPNRISKKVFTWSMRLAENGKIRNWCWQVRKLLTCLQLPEFYLTYNPPASCFNQLLHLVKDRIFRVASDKWIAMLNKPAMKNSETGGKLKLYKLFKAEPTPASYVLSPLDPGPRWVMASLRAGCLPLGVETGRYRIPKVPLERRVCLACNSNSIEDEFHFVMVCNKLEHERNKLLYHITQTDPSFMHLHPFNKFLYILNNESCCQNLIAKCLYKMFKLRSSFLYHS